MRYRSKHKEETRQNVCPKTGKEREAEGQRKEERKKKRKKRKRIN